MALPILIMGRSGSGKSTSLRNFEKLLVINVAKKPLPFKKNENIVVVDEDDYLKIRSYLSKAVERGYNSVVIDDAGYLMTNKFMAGHRNNKGSALYDLYNEIADNFYSLITYIQNDLPKELIVYILMHEDMNELGYIKPKTIGRLLDEKVCIEGLFTIVLHSVKNEGKYVFATNTDGLDVTKTPLGMFDTEYIDNDLQQVDRVVREFYKE